MYLPLNKFLRRFNMIGFIKKLFGAKATAPASTPAEAPYKIDTSSIHPMSPVAVPTVEAAPAVEAVVVIPEAVVPAAVIEQVPAKKAPAKRGTAKSKASAKPVVVKQPAVEKPRKPKAV